MQNNSAYDATSVSLSGGTSLGGGKSSQEIVKHRNQPIMITGVMQPALAQAYRNMILTKTAVQLMRL